MLILLILYYVNLNSWIICCLFSGDIYFSFGISISSKLLFCECNFLEYFEAHVILFVILLPIKSPVAYAVFWIPLFEAVFIASVVDFIVLSRSFWLYLLLKFLSMFLAKDKNSYSFTYILSLGWIE